MGGGEQWYAAQRNSRGGPEYAVAPLASRQIDRCVVKFPMGKDRIAEQENEQRERQGEQRQQRAGS
jgi:hypothetical protein